MDYVEEFLAVLLVNHDFRLQAEDCLATFCECFNLGYFFDEVECVRTLVVWF